MRTMNKRMTTLILAVALVTTMIVSLPTSAGAATGMATINISTLGATDLDNSASVATESQWVYVASYKVLYLTTEGGVYTLKGTNHNLTVYTDDYSMDITLDDVAITASADGGFALGIDGGDVSITLVGDSTLFSATTLQALNVKGSCVIGGSGTLWSEYMGSSNAYGILVGSGSSLTIGGSASITAKGPNAIYSVGDVLIGDQASLKLEPSGVAGVGNNLTVAAADAASTALWKLSGSATTADALTATSIAVYVPAGTTGKIARETIVEEPSLTPTLSDATLHFLYPQIGTTRQVTVTQLFDGTTPLGDWDWEIIGNTNPAVATVVDPTSGAHDDPLTIKALAPGQTVITVKVMEFANGLTGRYGLATITVTVDGPPTDNGGDKVPPTGDVTSLVAPALIAIISLLSISPAALERKRG